MSVRSRIQRKRHARISRARGVANLHARTPMTTFFSRLIEVRQNIDIHNVWLSLCEVLNPDFRINEGLGRYHFQNTWRLMESHYRGRPYHNFGHIADCLAYLRVVPFSLSKDESLVATLAIIFHDVCYDSWADDNEERSAKLAEFCLKRIGLDPFYVEWVKPLIMETKHNSLTEDSLGQLIADIDLVGLALSEKEFIENTDKIRAEYFWASDLEFISGRSEFFSRMLTRPSIYQTDWFRRHFEKSARANIKKALTELESLLN